MQPLSGYVDLGLSYRSGSQKARVISEAWLADHGFCLACESDVLIPTARNTRATDFFCPACSHAYELKSTRGQFGARVVDGAHHSLMARLVAGTMPTLFLLEYSPGWEIAGLSAIHHALLTPNAIQQRRPLASTARRAGWIGCNILLTNVPVEGRIGIVRNDRFEPKKIVRQKFKLAQSLATLPLKQRTWSSAVLLKLHELRHATFSIKDVYEFEPHFAQLFPENRHIRPKLRQQLQVLRNAGLLRFLGNGQYQFTIARSRPD